MVNLVRESNATNVVILIVRGGPLFSNYSYRAYLPEVKQQISDMAMNSSGIRDTAGVLRISPTIVIKMIKKSPHLKAINEKVLAQIQPSQTIVMLCQWEPTEAEMDEMWSFVGCKKQERWLWHADA